MRVTSSRLQTADNGKTGPNGTASTSAHEELRGQGIERLSGEHASQRPNVKRQSVEAVQNRQTTYRSGLAGTRAAGLRRRPVARDGRFFQDLGRCLSAAVRAVRDGRRLTAHGLPLQAVRWSSSDVYLSRYSRSAPAHVWRRYFCLGCVRVVFRNLAKSLTSVWSSSGSSFVASTISSSVFTLHLALSQSIYP